MNPELLDFLNSHASCRKFTDRDISSEQEETIVRTAQRSPTSSNLQAYSLVGIRNKEAKNNLARLCGNQDHVAQSSLFIVFCADLFRLSELNRQRSYSFSGEWTELFIVATVDAALAAGRALMAAQAMDMGGVMVGAIRNHPQEVSDLLHLPEFVYPVMGMSLGFPAKRPAVKPRLPLPAVYFRERYDPVAFQESINAYDRTIDELGHLKGREVRPADFPDFSGTYSWSEHTARRMSGTESSPSVRAHMLEFLRSKGFLRK
ncbi:MAG: NADPH-dependent oxidoreductase [bacterium]|nr:NADPH-dependent oxidoreductase [bacterium]